MKQLCTIHHFYHPQETPCPYCQKDKILSIVKKYLRLEKTSDRPVMLSDISRLAEKFKIKI